MGGTHLGTQMLVVDVCAKNIWTFVTAFTKQRHRGEDEESGYRELRESRPVPPPLEKVTRQHTDSDLV